MQLGDRKPSRLLLEMRSKASSQIGDDILKSLFLQRLPTTVQQILAISDDLDKLAKMADGIMSASDIVWKQALVPTPSPKHQGEDSDAGLPAENQLIMAIVGTIGGLKSWLQSVPSHAVSRETKGAVTWFFG
ncbi:retrovirus-like pol polyprotein [Lasius niger]|uniref:Retrovirus-like pol polyprotein n=1 Tax=Lasius niger TaxID=67767 RepID=A0A0J7JVE5_LASNI|nr:retrovirus-like pol polyprotein [Lasius niger]